MLNLIMILACILCTAIILVGCYKCIRLIMDIHILGIIDCKYTDADNIQNSEDYMNLILKRYKRNLINDYKGVINQPIIKRGTIEKNMKQLGASRMTILYFCEYLGDIAKQEEYIAKQVIKCLANNNMDKINKVMEGKQ